MKDIIECCLLVAGIIVTPFDGLKNAAKYEQRYTIHCVGER